MPDDDIGRDAQEIDHRRHHDEAAADTHDRRQDADAEAKADHRNDAQIDLRFLEAHLQRQAMHPAVMTRLARGMAGSLRAARRIAFRLSHSINPPIVPRKTT